MILVTGAAGKTGRAIIQTFTRAGIQVRALVKNQEQASSINTLGVGEVIIGDLHNEATLKTATRNIDAIYLICPNVIPDEFEIANRVLAAAETNSVKRIIYLSVLHPQIEAMPHHWQKMRVEERLFETDFDFTILQPCAYMQNILAGWDAILSDGVYSIPYSIESRISFVDLNDIAEAALQVITQPGHHQAIYELAGGEQMSQTEVAEIISLETGRQVKAVKLDPKKWEERSKQSGMNEYARDTLLRMFDYYDHYGLKGNPKILEMLLGRPSTQFSTFIKRYIHSTSATNS